MAVFCCNKCGKCCTSLGKYIRIERQLDEQDYYCKDEISGEFFKAHVPSEFSNEIDQEYTSQIENGLDKPNGCIFFRRDPSGTGFTCAIYSTRPQICRNFKCYRMIITKTDGTIVGRVVGNGDLQTTDETLLQIWTHEINSNSVPLRSVAEEKTPKFRSVYDDPTWVNRITATLSSHGYLCEQIT